MEKNIVETIKKNIRLLMELRGIASENALAKKAKVDQKTINNLMSPDTLSNPTIKVVTKLAQSLDVEPWMLLLEDFPFCALSARRLNKISAGGYALLDTYEKEGDMVQYGIMEAVSHSLCKVDERRSHEIKEAQAKYLVNRKKD